MEWIILDSGSIWEISDGFKGNHQESCHIIISITCLYREHFWALTSFKPFDVFGDHLWQKEASVQRKLFAKLTDLEKAAHIENDTNNLFV